MLAYLSKMFTSENKLSTQTSASEKQLFFSMRLFRFKTTLELIVLACQVLDSNCFCTGLRYKLMYVYIVGSFSAKSEQYEKKIVRIFISFPT